MLLLLVALAGLLAAVVLKLGLWPHIMRAGSYVASSALWGAGEGVPAGPLPGTFAAAGASAAAAPAAGSGGSPPPPAPAEPAPVKASDKKRD